MELDAPIGHNDGEVNGVPATFDLGFGDLDRVTVPVDGPCAMWVSMRHAMRPSTRVNRVPWRTDFWTHAFKS